MAETIVLSGDIGGTNARLAISAATRVPAASDVSPGAGALALRELWSCTLASADHGSLESVVRTALAASGTCPEAASFGVAGPVRDGRCRTTNLPWEVDAATVAAEMGLPRVGLLNDLEASAWGLPLLAADARVTVHAGAVDARGTQALLSVGTGLGEALIVPGRDGAGPVVVASEGGHASFAPRDAEQDELLRALRARHGHVSWERVLSGPGLVAVARHLAGRDPRGVALLARLDAADEGRVVTEAAAEGDPLAHAALGTFVRLCAAEAGNLALKALATGGVFLCGGIPPRIRPWLEGPDFVEAFLDKGRMRALLQSVPVTLVLDESLALRGAARHAALSFKPA